MGMWDKTHQEVTCADCGSVILVRVHEDGTFSTLHKCLPKEKRG